MLLSKQWNVLAEEVQTGGLPYSQIINLSKFPPILLLCPLHPGQRSYNHGQKSWDTCISGVFSNAQPLPSPHKQSWTRAYRIFLEFQLCTGWGEGELQDNFEKDGLFYEGN